MIALPRRHLSVLLASLITLFIIGNFGSSRFTAWSRSSRRASLRNQAIRSFGYGTTVAVFDRNRFHDEVHGAVLWTVKQFPGINILFYRQSWRYDFDKAIRSFWSEEPRDSETFLDDMRSDPSIRNVIFTTCDWDFGYYGSELEEIWKARPPAQRFNIICLRHWPGDGPTKNIAFFAGQNAASQIGLGDHVGRAINQSLEDAGRHFGRWEGNEAVVEGIMNMPIRTFVPMFPPDPPELSGMIDRVTGDKTLSLALIQSTFWDEKHRALKVTFDFLEASLRRTCSPLHTSALQCLSRLIRSTGDPSIWGYAPLTGTNEIYTPLPPSPGSPPPFQLVLLGAGIPGIPTPLKNLVIHWGDRPYPEYYEAMHAADLIIPAFGTEGYDDNRASSTIGTAATAKVGRRSSGDIFDSCSLRCFQVPVLTSEIISNAYG